MADKEATVYIVDVGMSMGESHHGRDESDLDWSLQYVWDRITSTVRPYDQARDRPVDCSRWQLAASSSQSASSACEPTVLSPVPSPWQWALTRSCPGTSNDLQADSSFDNISVLQPIGKCVRSACSTSAVGAQG